MSKLRISLILVFCLLGGLASLVGIVAILKGSVSSNWPYVEGSILHAETTRGGGSSRPQYFHTVRYTYVVGNKFFTGDRIAFMFDRGTTGNTLQFSAGQRVPVYYDPLNPSSSVLLRGIQPYYLFVTGLGFVFVTIGWLVYRNLPRRNFNSC